jgi:carbonic anhydrase
MHGNGVTPEEALRLLKEGNERYVNSVLDHPHQTAARRAELTGGQHPFAVILGCSDSRVPPEILFDQGIGDLFIIRTAGNVADDVALGSIEYGVEHLGIQLVVVLGHSSCGAVTATTQATEAPGHIDRLIKMIRPAVDQVQGQPGSLLENAIRANVERTVALLQHCEPILKEMVAAGHCQVVGAIYNLESGAVSFLS